MWAAGQLKPQAEANLWHTLAEGLYFQNKPSTRGLMGHLTRPLFLHADRAMGYHGYAIVRVGFKFFESSRSGRPAYLYQLLS